MNKTSIWNDTDCTVDDEFYSTPRINNISISKTFTNKLISKGDISTAKPYVFEESKATITDQEIPLEFNSNCPKNTFSKIHNKPKVLKTLLNSTEMPAISKTQRFLDEPKEKKWKEICEDLQMMPSMEILSIIHSNK
mmetsp:Transcript_7746/g.8843  ORF Transcript_7746/g.8843 Transcript_7746/m.8843 type:complete len:137 (-) Transcript_7746:61-471(-)